MFNLASKYVFVLKGQESYLLLVMLEKNVNGAIIQVGRVQRTRKRLAKMRDTKNLHNNLQRLSLDAHFYFICIEQVNRND